MYPAGTQDVKYINFFLENTAGSPYGILFNTAGNIGGLQIEDVNGNTLFPGTGVKLTDLIIPAGYESAVAEIPAVWYADEPVAPLIANTDYFFYIYQYDSPNNAWLYPQRIFFNTGSGALTAQTASIGWAKQINLYNSNGVLRCTAASTATGGHGRCTITTNTGYPIIRCTTPSPTVTLTQHTLGVASFGYPSDLAAKSYQLVGSTPQFASAPVATPNGYLGNGIYDLVTFYFDKLLVGSFGGGSRKQMYAANLWIDNNGNNYAAWQTYFLSVVQGTIANYSPQDTQLISNPI